MENHRPVVCLENEELAVYIWQKRQELAEKPKGLSEKLDMTLNKAYTNVCNSKTPIKTIKELSQVKGVGKWILSLTKGFFEAATGSGNSEPEELMKKGDKVRATKRYVPQKNSVAYALLISLYRGIANGNEFMRKQELIDAAEASGLSRVPVMPEKGKGKLSQFGSSPREWFSGWSCMKTLITKGLVVKSSCPAKYMLTKEGLEAARECILRSGLVDPLADRADVQGAIAVDAENESEVECVPSRGSKEVTGVTKRKERSIDIPHESLERFTSMGYSRDQVVRAFSEVSETYQNKETSALWPAVLCHLREGQIYGLHSESQNLTVGCSVASSAKIRKKDGSANKVLDRTRPRRDEGVLMDIDSHDTHHPDVHSADIASHSVSLRACSSADHAGHESNADHLEVNTSAWTMPPMMFGEKFEDAYEVILILDDREQFATQGSRSRKIIENICTQFKIKIEVRRLPVGDGIWIARHKQVGTEYVLDFIVERKNIDDLRSSIRDNHYRDQKLRLLRCGLKKLMYIVEGDPNCSEAAESIKTACFTTEILEGFDVLRTSVLGDTLRKYGYLTQAINQCYRSKFPEDSTKCSGVCPPYDEFVKTCQDLDKMTVSDVFAIQLMQVPQVTEEIAIAVLNLHPTLISLARAYSFLEGDVRAQEDLLRKESNNAINAVASRNIFQLVWGS